ncbi:hypothetical protein Gohar_027549 [Gossypium harknessii]|uniref:Uncharacterized protein n=1 Tax=Gossypium harknessii TaxID=34285 RepID=A0A7J9HXV3_9ROSI|nr:hypothetical protein [Gossypium harknessii]
MMVQQKLSYSGGSYMNGHFSQVYPAGQAVVGANTLMPMYPFYHYHQSQTMGLPAAATHIYPSTTAGPITTIPAAAAAAAAIISKPAAAMAPNSDFGGWGDLGPLPTGYSRKPCADGWDSASLILNSVEWKLVFNPQ